MEILIGISLIEFAILGIVILICRATGRKLPDWVRPIWLRDKIDNLINPDPKRLDKFAAALVRV